jgi:hypothetical protein
VPASPAVTEATFRLPWLETRWTQGRDLAPERRSAKVFANRLIPHATGGGAGKATIMSPRFDQMSYLASPNVTFSDSAWFDNPRG